MDWSNKADICRARKPWESPLWQLFEKYFEDFECRYDALFSQEEGVFRPVNYFGSTWKAVTFIKDKTEFVARIVIMSISLLQLSWSLVSASRSLLTCPSCPSKKVVPFGSHFQDNVIFPVQHQVIASSRAAFNVALGRMISLTCSGNG